AYNPYKNLGKVLKRSNMILRLLRQKGVLDAGEYQIALAESPNVGRLQKKVDEVISTPPVFEAPSSARNDVVEKMPGEQQEKVPESGEDAAGEQQDSGSASQPAAPMEAEPEKK
ncbi:MAG: transglycosylase, partial [Desulfuromonadaceae bacterium]|nr:transglycosylase [Desulfuromonadaceae bacterium]